MATSSRLSNKSPKDLSSLLCTRLTNIQDFGEPADSNHIIQGDNLVVLKGFREEFESQIKTVYIDPPYNNQETYNYYIDGAQHDVWIAELEQRLELLFKLLKPDGSLWISIDDREVHYLKVACDRLFGRDKFVTTIIWQQRKSRENRRVFSNNHEYILVYAKAPDKFTNSRNPLPLSESVRARYKNPDNDPRGPWQSVSANVQEGHGTPQQYYTITAPNGKRHSPPKGRCWIYPQERMKQEIEQQNIWFGKSGDGVPRIKKFLAESNRGLTPETLWFADDVGTTRGAKKQILEIFPDEMVFDTPKPESLLKRIIEISSNPGDLILDAYLGSGTTTAVAHKMGRRYIGIENGAHVVSLCVERMKSIIEGGNDGISPEINWKGGGGYRFGIFK